MPLDPSDVVAVALLDEPVRRSLFEYVRSRTEPVGRDEAARGVGISRSLAAFHLDRLADDGLLTTSYRRLSGRSGPGAGRPAKLYGRSDREISIAVPDRRYDTAARLLAEALEAIDDRLPGTLANAGRAFGARAGAAARASLRRDAGRIARRNAIVAALRGRGYEPRLAAEGSIELGNCPYHALVEDHRQLVCGMNLAIAEGLVTGVADTGLEPRLEPADGRCCVVLRDVASGPSRASG